MGVAKFTKPHLLIPNEILPKLFILYVWMFLHVRLYTMFVPGDCKGQKRASDPLELDLKTIMSYQVGAGNQILVL